MTFTPLSLFDFQPLEKGKGDRKRGILEIAVRSHRIDLSKSVFEQMGKPETIQIGTDGNFLAIWAEDGAFQVSTTRGSGASINGKENVVRLQNRLGKLKEVDFKTQYVILSDPVIDDGKLIYNADSLMVCQKLQRRIA